MILCPNCQHHEISGALFCSECGAALAAPESLSTQSIYRSQSDGLPRTHPKASKIPQPVLTGDAFLTLYLIDSNETLPLAGRNEYTLGRISEGQPILPDVDMSPYDAYNMGVSRLHAAIKLNNQKINVVDLGSSNGTRVNGQKIMANVDYPLHNGDLLSLGRLKIQVLIRR
jgi:pSer/pThr/pTyr-binding forkhead associated (FHA) protein